MSPSAFEELSTGQYATRLRSMLDAAFQELSASEQSEPLVLRNVREAFHFAPISSRPAFSPRMSRAGLILLAQLKDAIGSAGGYHLTPTRRAERALERLDDGVGAVALIEWARAVAKAHPDARLGLFWHGEPEGPVEIGQFSIAVTDSDARPIRGPGPNSASLRAESKMK